MRGRWLLFPAGWSDWASDVTGLDAIPWLLRDEFTDTLAAGSVDGTAATPGPGTRDADDTGNNITVSGNNLVVAGGTNSWTTTRLTYGARTRVAGRVLLTDMTYTAGAVTGSMIGWARAAAPDVNFEYSLTVATNTLVLGQYGLANINVETLSAATAYAEAIVLRGTGAYYFLRGGAFATWTLLYIGSSHATATLYPGYNNYARAYTSGYIRVPDVLWNPPHLAYDTFTRANGALGTTETAGPEAQAVTARLWQAIGGDLQVVGNAAQGVAAQANLVGNPGFEIGGTGGDYNGGAEIDDGTSDDFSAWTNTSVNDGTGDKVEATATVHAGSAAAKLTNTTSGLVRTQKTATVTAGTLYLVSVFSRGDGAQAGRWSLYSNAGLFVFGTTSTGNATAVYAKIHLLVAGPTGGTNLQPILWSSSAAGVVYFDDVSILPCHADYIEVGAADVQMVWNVTTPAAGTTPFGLILRRNGATQWLAKVTPGTAGTDFELIELNNGVPTVRATADVDWTAATSYSIQVSCSAAAINVYANGTLYLTYASATVGQTNTQFGMFDAAESNASFLDMQIMNKDGAYEALDTWAAAT